MPAVAQDPTLRSYTYITRRNLPDVYFSYLFTAYTFPGLEIEQYNVMRLITINLDPSPKTKASRMNRKQEKNTPAVPAKKQPKKDNTKKRVALPPDVRTLWVKATPSQAHQPETRPDDYEPGDSDFEDASLASPLSAKKSVNPHESALERDKQYKKCLNELTGEFGASSEQVKEYKAQNHPTTGNLVLIHAVAAGQSLLIQSANDVHEEYTAAENEEFEEWFLANQDSINAHETGHPLKFANKHYYTPEAKQLLVEIVAASVPDIRLPESWKVLRTMLKVDHWFSLCT
ncbi:hypothetical protein HDU80_002794 [Chytriomyces hyalinus]|nr:hypothetical protein HDU80_002794 [Chytriomyces hyalinus]